MGGATKGLGKVISKVTKLHDTFDPIGKPIRNKIEDKAGVTRLNELGDEIAGTGKFAQSTQVGQVITPAGAPTTNDAAVNAEQANILRRRRGRASTMLTGISGDTSTVNVGTKTLLG